MNHRSPLFALVGTVSFAAAATANAESIETINVIATPLTSLEADTLNVQVATADELAEQGALSIMDYMTHNFAGVFVNEAQDNPLQPDLQYRGYVGSPLLGLPQGLAVYQDSVRINEPFGDTVNWSQIPQAAIAKLYLVPGSNPLYGLNALGGSIAIDMKDGFSYPGTRVGVSGGSFGRVAVDAETGGTVGETFSHFLSGSYLEEDGWRDHSPTDATQLFGKATWRWATGSIAADITHVATDLTGNGATPVQLLHQSRSAIFTRPDRTQNDLTLVSLKGIRAFGADTSATVSAYARESDIDTYNGDNSDFEACDDLPGFLCEESDGGETPLFDSDGALIAARDEVASATINRTHTRQSGAGAAIQVSHRGLIAGRPNDVVIGLVYDASNTTYHASTELGALDASRRAVPAGVVLGESATKLHADVGNGAVYLADSISMTDVFALTLSARYNSSDVALHDEIGTALDGRHGFTHLNPGVLLRYDPLPGTSLYVSWGESNRAPSPVELTCADAGDPCRLPNAFVADPSLHQVVAATSEIGASGAWQGINWRVTAFRTTNSNDIVFVSAGALTNEGFFENVGDTRRDGIEIGMNGTFFERLNWFVNYSHLIATFRSDFAVQSPNNPEATDGEIMVQRGDRLPLVPDHLFKAGASFKTTPRLTIGIDVLASAGAHLRGDEANVTKKLDDYCLVGARAQYSWGKNAVIDVAIENLFDEHYETFGAFSNAEEVLGNAYDDRRFLSPGAPRGAWIGVKFEF